MACSARYSCQKEKRPFTRITPTIAHPSVAIPAPGSCRCGPKGQSCRHPENAGEKMAEALQELQEQRFTPHSCHPVRAKLPEAAVRSALVKPCWLLWRLWRRVSREVMDPWRAPLLYRTSSSGRASHMGRGAPVPVVCRHQPRKANPMPGAIPECLTLCLPHGVVGRPVPWETCDDQMRGQMVRRYGA